MLKLAPASLGDQLLDFKVPVCIEFIHKTNIASNIIKIIFDSFQYILYTTILRVGVEIIRLKANSVRLDWTSLLELSLAIGMSKNIPCLVNMSNNTNLFVKNVLLMNSFVKILVTSWRDLEKYDQRIMLGYLAIESLFKLLK